MSFVGQYIDDATHYFSDAFDWTTGELDKVYTWTDTEVGKLAGWTAAEAKAVGPTVFSFVTHGIQAVEHIYNEGIDGIHHVIHDLKGDFDKVGDWAASAAKWIASAPAYIAHEIEDGATVFRHDVIDPIVHDVESSIDDVKGAVTTGLGALGHDISHIEHDVLPEITKWIGDAGHWFSTEFHTAWVKVEHDVIDPALSELTTVKDDVTGAVKWIDDEATGAIALIVECAEWLEWMAVHSFSDLEAVLSTVTGGLSLANLTDVVQLQPTTTTGIDSFASQLFATPTS